MPFTTGTLLCTNIWTYSVSELLLICVSLYGLNGVSFPMLQPVSVHFSVSTFLLEPCPHKMSHQSHNNCQTTEEKMFRLGAENELPELTQENKFLGSCRISNSLDQDRFFLFFFPQDCAVRWESWLFQTSCIDRDHCAVVNLRAVQFCNLYTFSKDSTKSLQKLRLVG